jgi:precorrin-4 methylase
MYTLNIPVSTIRTKMRQEFERHRYVSKLKTTDVLIYNSHAEFQVRTSGRVGCDTDVEDGGTDTFF